MYSLLYTSAYRKGRRLMARRGYDMAKLDRTISLLIKGESLPASYRDHQLKGDLKKDRECHVEGAPDWLLTYRKDDKRLILLLTGTGTHSDLFE